MSFLQSKLPNIPAEKAGELKAHILSGGYPEWDGEDVTAKDIALQLSQRSKIANPLPVPQALKPMSIAGVFGVLSDEGKQLVKSFGPSGQEPIRNDIKSSDREAVVMWATINLSADDAAAVQAEVLSTISDPDHPAQIIDDSPLQKLCGCGGISAAEVAYILNDGE